jgi:hypothetical protein
MRAARLVLLVLLLVVFPATLFRDEFDRDAISENLLITQHVSANRSGDKTSDSAQSSTTELVTKHRAASASKEGGT